MAQFVNMHKVELSNSVAPVVSLRQIFYGDVAANRIGAIVLMNGAPVTLGGTCSGTAILADGSTVALTGTVSGNEAYVVLSSGCYSMEGQIQVFVKLTVSGVTTTLLAAVGTVRLTETDRIIDPGTIIPSVSALITSIEDAIASIPADYSALLGSIAHTFSTSTAYTAGQYVWYNGELYRFNAAHPAGAWIGTDAARYTATDELPLIQQALGTKADAAEVADLKSALNTLDDTLILTTTDNIDLPIAEKQTMKLLRSTGEIDDGTLTNQLVCAFDVSGYSGCVFSFQGRTNAEQYFAFYTCEIISECGLATLCSEVGQYNSGVEKTIDEIPAGAKLLVAGMRQNPYKIQGILVTVSAKSDANLASTYSLTRVYEIGEYCIHNGNAYRRIVYSGQSGAWNDAEWESVRITEAVKTNTDEISSVADALENKVSKENTVVSEKTLMFTDAIVNHSQKLITSDGTITDGTLTNQVVTEIKIPSNYDKMIFKAQMRTSAEAYMAIYNADAFEECGPSTLVSISQYKGSGDGYQNEIDITSDTKILCVLNRGEVQKCDVQKLSSISSLEGNFAEPYDFTKEYRPSEYCTKDEAVYKRKESESYAAESWNEEHWDKVSYAFEHETEQDFTAFSDFVVGRINTQTGGIISSYVSAISKDIFKLDRDIIVSISDGYWFNFVAYGSYEESSIIRSIDSGFGSNLTHIPAGTYMRAVIGETGRQSTEQLQESEIKNIARKITFISAYGDQQVKIENGQTAMYKSDTALMFQKGAAEKTFSKQPCILVAGQSNIDGRVPASSLPEEVAAAFPNVLMANSSTGAFSSIGQASGNQGIDRSMYKALNDSGNGNIYIIKRSMGATAISPYGSTKCWTPWYEELDDISNSLLYSFDLLTKKCIAQSGSLFDIKAFLWQQGEGDYSTLTSGNRKAAFAYYRNFKALVAYVRGMANNPRLPIVCGTVSHLSGQYDPIVEAATIKVAEEDPYMTCIDMSGAGLLDAYHFNADAAVYFGYKAFDALIDFGVVTGTKINPTRPW